VKPRRRVKWTEAGRVALEALLVRANGKRTARLLTMEGLERCVMQALEQELGVAWASAGEPPDARASTSVCLAVVDDHWLTVGVASAHAPALPSNGWNDLPAWDRYWDAANVSASRAWAGRVRADRVRFELEDVDVPSTASADELLQAVVAAPADDAPRLVLADWLTERGDPRGEFISMQIALERGLAEDEERLNERAQKLLEAHGARWSPDPALARVHFKRGFAEAVEVLDASALPQLEDFLSREPVRNLIFNSTQRLDAARFAALPWIERLMSLSFKGPRPQAPAVLSRAQLPYLLESRGLRGLRRLSLSSQWLEDEGFGLLSERGAAAFPDLEWLAVEDDVITAAGVRAHVESRWSARLSVLSLAGNRFGVDGVEALASSRRPGQLRQLILDHDAIGNAGAIVLAGARRFASLDTLSLRFARITAPGAEALLNSDVLQKVLVIDLEGNQVGEPVRERLRQRFAR
jgi:uncharacterized protein (TIGR02996 family)